MGMEFRQLAVGARCGGNRGGWMGKELRQPAAHAGHVRVAGNNGGGMGVFFLQLAAHVGHVRLRRLCEPSPQRTRHLDHPGLPLPPSARG